MDIFRIVETKLWKREWGWRGLGQRTRKLTINNGDESKTKEHDFIWVGWKTNMWSSQAICTNKHFIHLRLTDIGVHLHFNHCQWR